MPIVSDAQRKAMFAAKAGHSTLGIPQSVGAEFVKAGPASKNLPERIKPQAASTRDYAKGGAVNAVMRNRIRSLLNTGE